MRRTLLLSGCIALLWLQDGAAKPNQDYTATKTQPASTNRASAHNEDAQIHEFQSWSLQPGGSLAAYVVKEGDGAARTLIVQDVKSRKIEQIAHQGLETFGARVGRFDFHPVWSPDGSGLAFIAWSSDHAGLKIWRPGSHGQADEISQVEPCSLANAHGCRLPGLIWSPDGKRLYILTQPSTRGTDQGKPCVGCGAQDTSSHAAWRKLLLDDPEAHGITVWESHPSPRISEQPRSPAIRDLLAANVVAVDIATGSATTILAGVYPTELAVAPDGRHLLVVSRNGVATTANQFYSDFFIVPVEEGLRHQFVSQEVELQQRAPDSEPIAALLRDVKQGLGPAVWSPDSQKIAFVERGPLAAGDVLVADLAGRTAVLTAGALTREDGENVPDGTAVGMDELAPGPKFNDTSELEWSADSDALYAVRRAHIGQEWRRRLWRIPLRGTPINISAGAKLDVGLPLIATEGESGRPLELPVEDPAGQFGFARIDQTGRLAVAAHWAGQFAGGLTRATAFSLRAGGVLFIAESPNSPPEAYLHVLGSKTDKRLTSINLTSAERWKDMRQFHIEWQAPDGEQRAGSLLVPSQATRLPALVVTLYPRDAYDPTRANMMFIGDSGRFLPPVTALLASGYAIFEPSIPVTGGGRSCIDVAQDVERALQAIDKAQLADTTRSAIIGHSFGGWAVQCAITHTTRFAAAVSISGVSDLIRDVFSPSGAAQWGIGGGQARIGRSIWDAGDLYWRESPLSGAPAVTTPLLLLHGKADVTVPVEQSAEMYLALSRLGKEVSLVAYDDVDHLAILGLQDVESRVLSWVKSHTSRDQRSSEQKGSLCCKQ